MLIEVNLFHSVTVNFNLEITDNFVRNIGLFFFFHDSQILTMI